MAICVTFQYINNNDLHNWWHVTSRCRHLRHSRPFFMMKFKLFSGYDEHYKQKLRVCVADKWWNVISTWLSNAWKCRSLGLERQLSLVCSHLVIKALTKLVYGPETVALIPVFLSTSNKIQRDKDTRLWWKGRGYKFDERMSQQSNILYAHMHTFCLSAQRNIQNLVFK